ncbi:MAG: hypothetical protein FJ290_25525, partial [Planctomycetes bacterium]|nr:hypothetical protein [Planctomycetota bacterium]
MGRFMQRVAREWRRVRVALVVLALGSAVWTVVLRLTAGQGVAPGDWVEATAGLAIAVAAVALPLASLAGDRRLARLASRRGGRLPRWPILAPKWLACFGAWLALSVGASAFSLLWLPSWECLTEWVGMLDAGWLWVVVGFGGAFFASAATGQLRAAIPLALLLGILPPFLMRYPFDLSLSEGGGHGTKALAGALATLWLLAAAALAFPARFAAPAGAWARALARLRTGVCVGLAVLCAASVVPLILVVPSLLLGPGDATAVSEPRLSPDGRFVAFVVHFKAWPLHPCSCYVLNTESGQAWRLSRFQQSALRFPGECDWSPGGRCLAYCVYPGPLREARLRLAGADVGHAEDLGIFDTLTGEAREVRHPAIHYGSRIRWKEEGVIGVESEDWSAGGRIFQTWGATGSS